MHLHLGHYYWKNMPLKQMEKTNLIVYFNSWFSNTDSFI